MTAHQLSTHYKNSHRTIHWAEEQKPPSIPVSLLAARMIMAKKERIEFSCADASVLLERDTAEIARLAKMYPVFLQPIPQPIPGRPQSRGFRTRLKSRLPEIRILMDKGESAWEIGQKLNLSETTIRRAFRHLRGEPSDEKNAVAVIGTHKLTGEMVEFPSMSQAENYGGFLGSKIGLCLIGQASHHRGYIWRRA